MRHPPVLDVPEPDEEPDVAPVAAPPVEVVAVDVKFNRPARADCCVRKFARTVSRWTNWVTKTCFRAAKMSFSVLIRCSTEVADACNPLFSTVNSPFTVSVNELTVFLSLVAKPLVESRKKLLTAVGFCAIF